MLPERNRLMNLVFLYPCAERLRSGGCKRDAERFTCGAWYCARHADEIEAY